MGKIMLRRKQVASIVLHAATPGSRAVFLVETRSAEDRRKLSELFRALAELGEVVPLADGPLMAFAVQLRNGGESGPAGSLFSKIEATLKDEFPFTLVEQSFNDVVYHLVESLAEDSGGRMHPVLRCGICSAYEPFPTRISLQDEGGHGIIEACYCARCASQRADPNEKELVARLLADDRRGFRGILGDDLVEWPSSAESLPAPHTYRLAS
jgi:hypothetical protein